MQSDQYQPPVVQLHDLQFTPLIEAEAITARVNAIGAALTTQYGDKNPLFIGVLNGAFVFTADLMRAFQGDCNVSFVKLSSYEGTQSSGTVKTVMGLEEPLEGRHLIVMEDILDTGRTLYHFLDYLREQNPASLTTAVFLRKPSAAQFEVHADYVCFDIEDRFVVGYGLDYRELGRNLGAVYQLMV
jgi:hypoxanthine phosphoribosyltransferase